MRKVWCARCGAEANLPRETSSSRVQCRVCGYVEEIPRGAEYPLAEPPPAPNPATPPLPPAPEERHSEGEQAPSRLVALLHASGKEPSRLGAWSVLLLLLSAADLFTTYLLFRTSHVFYEANPVARLFFDRWNMAGMVLFKFSVIGGVIALAEYIERRRPGWGKAIMLIGCAAAAYAVVRGLRLFVGFGAEEG